MNQCRKKVFKWYPIGITTIKHRYIYRCQFYNRWCRMNALSTIRVSESCLILVCSSGARFLFSLNTVSKNKFSKSIRYCEWSAFVLLLTSNSSIAVWTNTKLCQASSTLSCWRDICFRSHSGDLRKFWNHVTIALIWPRRAVNVIIPSV